MAVSNKTYNNVVNTIARMGEEHYQISTISIGDLYDVDLEKETKFPLLHINPLNVTTGDSQLNMNFQIFIMDMVSEKSNWQTQQHSLLTKLVNTKNNEQEVFNNTLNICTDIIAMFRHSLQQSLQGVDDINAPLYFTEGQFTIEPFQERFDNMCCGWVFQIGITTMNDFEACKVPVLPRGAGY